jgi:ABC-type transporter Mla subunit MlaD
MPKQTRRTNYFRLGLFVTVGLLMMAAVTLIFGLDRYFRRSVPYVTYFEKIERNLMPGSAVFYMGMQAGSVADLRLRGAEGKTYIEVLMKVDPNIEVTDYTRVEVRAPLIVGPAFLEITETRVTRAKLVLPFEPPRNYIPSAFSPVDRYTYQLEEILRQLAAVDVISVQHNVLSIISNVNTRLADPQLDAVLSALYKVVEVASNVSSELEVDDVIVAVGSLRSVLSNMVLVSARVEQSLGEQRTERLAQNIDDSLAQIPPSMDSLQSVSSNLVLVTTRIEQAMGEQRTERLMENIDRSLASVPPNMDELQVVLADIRQLTATLERLLEHYERNPDALIFGGPLPRAATPGEN